LIHDGTNGLNINSLIRQRDQLRGPTAPDAKRYLRAQEAQKAPAFGLTADIDGAHRIIQVREEDWPHQACQVRPGGNVYLNKVGTFGIATAAYWWGRIMAAMGRLIHYACLTDDLQRALWLMVYADDLKFEAVGSGFAEILLAVVVLLETFGFPIKWTKVAGGWEFQWVGYQIHLKEFSLGLAERRAMWLIAWYDRLLKNKVTAMSDFRSSLGRACFGYGALEFDKPFLGPLFSFAAFGAKESIRTLPVFVLLVVRFLRDRLRKRRMYPCATTEGGPVGEYRVDAKAEGQDVSVAGWEPAYAPDGSILKGESRWFEVTLTRDNAAWAFEKDGEPFRVIAPLEALGTIIGFCIFGPPHGGKDPRRATSELLGFTDNRGNTFSLVKLMTTRYPLCCLVMEFAAQQESRSTRVDLKWAPRERNEEADILTRRDFTGFNLELRVPFDVTTYPWIVLNELLKEGKEFYEEVRIMKTTNHDKRRIGDDTSNIKNGKKRLRTLRERDPW
jgi:hypothetical protein